MLFYVKIIKKNKLFYGRTTQNNPNLTKNVILLQLLLTGDAQILDSKKTGFRFWVWTQTKTQTNIFFK